MRRCNERGEFVACAGGENAALAREVDGLPPHHVKQTTLDAEAVQTVAADLLAASAGGGELEHGAMLGPSLIDRNVGERGSGHGVCSVRYAPGAAGGYPIGAPVVRRPELRAGA